MAIRTCQVGDSVPNFFGSLQAGDIARFRQGTHNQGGVCTSSASDVTFESTPGERATFTGSDNRMRFYGDRQVIQNLNFTQTLASELEFAGVNQRLFDCDLTNAFSLGIRSYIDKPGFISRRNFFHQIGRPSFENDWSIFAHAFYIRKEGQNFLSEDDRFFQILGGY